MNSVYYAMASMQNKCHLFAFPSVKVDQRLVVVSVVNCVT